MPRARAARRSAGSRRPRRAWCARGSARSPAAARSARRSRTGSAGSASASRPCRGSACGRSRRPRRRRRRTGAPCPAGTSMIAIAPAPVASCTRISCPMPGSASLSIRSSPSSTANDSSPIAGAPAQHRVAEPERLLLANRDQPDHVRDRGHRVGELDVAARRAACARARTRDRSDPRSRALWRPLITTTSVMPAWTASSITSWIVGNIDDRQHLLRHGLGRREEPGPKAGSRDHRFSNLEPTPT